jgi:hypothetical protein
MLWRCAAIAFWLLLPRITQRWSAPLPSAQRPVAAPPLHGAAAAAACSKLGHCLAIPHPTVPAFAWALRRCNVKDHCTLGMLVQVEVQGKCPPKVRPCTAPAAPFSTSSARGIARQTLDAAGPRPRLLPCSPGSSMMRKRASQPCIPRPAPPPTPAKNKKNHAHTRDFKRAEQAAQPQPPQLEPLHHAL